MAPRTGPNASSSTLSMKMKLLVNTKAGRVVYAEAGKEVVDFVLSLLTLPVGAVVKLLSKDAMVGSIGNVYGSVEEMDSVYLPSAYDRNALLSLSGERGSGTRLLHLQALATAATARAPEVFQFQCSMGGHDSCHKYVSVAWNASCHLCGGEMNQSIKVVGFPAPEALGFVKDVVTYTITDDLKVAPMSTATLLNALGVTDISSLQEMTVQVGYAEGLELLRASLQSKAVLTDVFLGREEEEDEEEVDEEEEEEEVVVDEEENDEEEVVVDEEEEDEEEEEEVEEVDEEEVDEEEEEEVEEEEEEDDDDEEEVEEVEEEVDEEEEEEVDDDEEEEDDDDDNAADCMGKQEEDLEMLRESLQSKAVLTDVFLRKKKNIRQQAVAARANKKRKLLTTTTLSKVMLTGAPLKKKKGKGRST